MPSRVAREFFILCCLGLLIACSEPVCAQGAVRKGGRCVPWTNQDAGTDAGPDEPIACDNDKPEGRACTCGANDCEVRNAALLKLYPCCDERHDDACGVQLPAALYTLEGCHAEHQPGNTSEGCAAFLDQLEGDPPAAPSGSEPYAPYDHTNGLYDIALTIGHVQLPACCTPTGGCGVQVDNFLIDPDKQNSSLKVAAEFGCIPVGDVAVSETALQSATVAPFCVPNKQANDSACPPKLSTELNGGTINYCEKLSDAFGGVIIACDETAPYPAWACVAAQLPLIDGSTPSLSPCMEYLPEYIRGCGAGSVAPKCVPNIPEDIFGCAAIESGPIPGMPEFACGCGDGSVNNGSGLGCIPNVPESVCGADPVDTGSSYLDQVPKFVCGCGDAAPAPSTVCLKNVDRKVCGTQPETKYLAQVPEFVCGCGAGVLGPRTGPFTCLNNVDKSVCGTMSIAAGNPVLSVLNDYLCGCGEGVRWSGPPAVKCLDNVGNANAADDKNPSTAICGTITTTGAIADFPSAWCGCGSADFDGTCLPNTETTECGAQQGCTGAGSRGSCEAGKVCTSLSGGAAGGAGDVCTPD